MHFWIDKRSQACGFGRARVAASLSTGGLGFGQHPPRRARGKSMVMPIHRFPAVECRPHAHRSSSQQHSTTTSQSTITQSQQNNSNSYSHHPHQHQQQQQQHHHHTQHTHHSHPLQQQHQHQHLHHHHHQHQSSHHTQPQPIYQQQLSPQPQQCVAPVPVPLSQIYAGPSHSPELEHGALGVGSISPRPRIVTNPPPPNESQLLPSHLKCGMWASLALATVFVAGAKFYFDHQGTGLEVLIFCAFSATFFLVACTVSLCRRPRDHNQTPSAISDQGQNTDRSSNIQASNQSELNSTTTTNTTNTPQSIAPPPPYHIAILLPETTKDIDEETPPPSYDKIVI